MRRRLFTFLSLDGADKTKPLYQQISQIIIDAINDGLLQAGDALPGTRDLAGILNVHRQTVIEAYSLLTDKGICKAIEGKGTFISALQAEPDSAPVRRAGFSFNEFGTYEAFSPQSFGNWQVKFDDGLPDPNLAPVLPLTMAYKRIYYQKIRQKKADITYGSPEHVQALKGLSSILRFTRGLSFDSEHFCLILGNQMALYLVAQSLIQPGEYIAIEDPADAHASAALERAHARLIPISVDAEGLNIQKLAEVCEKQPIRAVYVTPQGQYPTGVSMSEQRRNELLALAKKYHFAIIEVEYDHEFMYSNSYVAPLLKRDMDGNVIYLSCLSRMMAPFSLVSFVIGPSQFIKSLKGLWSALDYQGDAVLEQAVIDLIREGTLQKFIRKSNAAYRIKREQFGNILMSSLHKHADIIMPQSGLAFWVQFKKESALENVTEHLRTKNIYLPSPALYIRSAKQHNGIRLGFASQTTDKWITGVKAIAAVLTMFFAELANTGIPVVN